MIELWIEKDGAIVAAKSIEEWADHFDKHRSIKYDVLDYFKVSTIFSGVLDDLYSTAVFPSVWPDEGKCMIELRFDTREAAIAKHDEIVEKLRQGEGLAWLRKS